MTGSHGFVVSQYPDLSDPTRRKSRFVKVVICGKQDFLLYQSLYTADEPFSVNLQHRIF